MHDMHVHHADATRDERMNDMYPTQSITHSLTHTLTYTALTHSLIHSHNYSLTHSFIHTITHLLEQRSLTHTLTQAHSLTQLLTYFGKGTLTFPSSTIGLKCKPQSRIPVATACAMADSNGVTTSREGFRKIVCATVKHAQITSQTQTVFQELNQVNKQQQNANQNNLPEVSGTLVPYASTDT